MTEHAKEVDSTLLQVTLYEDRAEVQRRIVVPAGETRVLVPGLSPCLDERSVEVLSGGDERPSDEAAIPSHRVVYHRHAGPGAADDRAVETLAAIRREAEQQRRDASEREKRAAEERARLDSLLATVIQGARALRPRREDGPKQVRDAVAALSASLAQAIDREATAHADLAVANRELERATQRLSEARTVEPDLSARLVVSLPAAVAEDRSFTVRYRVASALWRPEHLARLVGSPNGIEGDASVEIVTYATAWQTTGESWEDAPIRFSTARPTRPAAPPPLTEDTLHTTRRTDNRVVVEARDQTIALAASSEGGARESRDLLGVDDGGEPLTFEPPERVSFPSTGRPLRVEIERRTLAATAVRIVYPERSPVAHVRATVTLTGRTPLLAGPLRLARNESIVGKTRLDFAPVGEPFDLGFGPDDSIRVKREVKEDRDVTTLTGSQRIRRTVRVFVSNVSGLARSFDVVERIPVSEIGDVEVLAETNDWSFDGKDGFAKRRIDLQPGAIASLLLSYEIRASSKVALPF